MTREENLAKLKELVDRQVTDSELQGELDTIFSELLLSTEATNLQALADRVTALEDAIL